MPKKKVQPELQISNQNPKVTQRTIQMDEFTITQVFLSKKSMDDCFFEVLKQHIQYDEKNDDFIN